MLHEIDKLQLAINEEIKMGVSLCEHTSFKIGGSAKYFCALSQITSIINLIKYADKVKLPYFVLGGGSNVLVADSGFDGLVIKINNSNLKIKDDQIECGAGVFLSKAVGEALASGLSGLEWAIGIPGTVGGAVHNNAGAFSGDMAQTVWEVTVLRDGKIKKVNNKKCNFAYRSSVFKQIDNRDVILSVMLNLAHGDKGAIGAKMSEVISCRHKKLDKYPGVGSVFKNVNLSDSEMKDFVIKHSDVPENFVRQNIVPAAWLVEQCGLKGKKIGGAMVSENHSGQIINVGGATAEDVIILISLIKQKVRTVFGLQLMEEIEYVGF